MNHVTFFDVIVVLFILFLALKGIFRGFIKEAFSLVGIIGGIFIASRYSQEVGEFIDKNLYHFQNHSALSLLGFLILLVAIWAAAVFLGAVFSSLIKEGLSVIDRTFGFLVGVLKVFLIVSVIVYIISSIDILKVNLEKYSKNSMLYPYLVKTGAYILKDKNIKAKSVSSAKTGDKEKKKESNISKEEGSEANKSLNN